MSVIIMRGISGAGKSWYVKNRLKGDLAVVSADHFFYNEGVYMFNPARLGEAHAQCFRSFMLKLAQKSEYPRRTLVVDNTNIATHEIAPYYMAATAEGVDVEIVTLKIDPQKAFNRNQHGLTTSQIWRQARLIEEQTGFMPHYWRHTVEFV